MRRRDVARFSALSLVLASLALLAGPVGAAPQTQAGAPPLWMEPLGTFMRPASSRDAYTYRKGDLEFHRELHASMKGRVRVIRVKIAEGSEFPVAEFSMNRPSLLETDPGLVRWTKRIRDTGGEIIGCPSQAESGIASILLQLFGEIAAKWVNDYVTYRPAEAYHAIVVYSRDTDQVEQVKFVLRNSVNIETLDCEAALKL